MPKRKREKSVNSANPRQSPPTCILHVLSMSDHGGYIRISDIKGNSNDKLQQLHKIRDRRLNQSHDSPYRMQLVCDQIPTTFPDDLKTVGYHRQCYQRFTSNLHLLRDVTQPEPSTSQRHHSTRNRKLSSPDSARPIFPKECIFCEKIEKKDGDRKTERAQSFSSYKFKENAWQQIESRAEKMGLDRLHRQVKNQDLFACEAKSHPSCFKSFRTSFANYERGIGRTKEPKQTEYATMSAAHDQAFKLVLGYIQTHIVLKHEVLRLSSLRLLYVEELKNYGYENSNYRSEKLLKRLQNDPIKDNIQFTRVDHKKGGVTSFWVVYSSGITISNAIAQAYTLGSTDKYRDIALLLRQKILKAFRESKDLPWPPTTDDMELSSENLLPPELIRFLTMVMTGEEDVEISEKFERLVFSIGQDLCRAVSEGRWKLPKHMLLCMTVRHLFRSKQLTNILHRLGHSESYNFAIELETDLAKALDQVSTFITPQIVVGEGNVVFHCEWDNLNKTTTNVHGSYIVNSAGGIMLQEVKPGLENSKVRTLPIIYKSQQRNKNVDTPETLPPLVFTRVGPKLPDGSSLTPPAENDAVYVAMMKEYYIWLFSRYIGSNSKQPMPGLGGFTSATGVPPHRKSTVDYFTPIHQPITDNSVVCELLKRSEVATAEVGQKWVLNTFDLGVCMKALPIIWRWPDAFANHVVMIGPFHTSMNFIGMLVGHKMRGSGYAEILIEAQMVTSGSLKGVLSGKAYAKSLFCLKTMCEAMERLLIQQFTEEENIAIADTMALLNMAQSCDREHLNEALKDSSTLTLIDKYRAYEEKVRNGHLGKWHLNGHLKKLEKNPRFHKAFGQLGDDWNVKPEVLKQLEQFTCLMYGENRESSVDVVRTKLLRKMVGVGETLTSKSKVDLARLPPCKSALKPHVQRVNHRVALYKRADQQNPEKPKPYDGEQGWMRTEEGVLEPVWSYGSVLPTSLVDLLDTDDLEDEDEAEEEDEEEDEEIQFDFDGFTFSDSDDE